MSEPAGTVPVEGQLYCLFAGMVDQLAVQRFHNVISIASQNNIQHVHLLFQTSGGLIGDGVSLYNLFRACPFDLTLYNVGSVSSVGVIAYLGAKHRKCSKHASFMIHRSYCSPAVATTERLTSAAEQLVIDDKRTEAILKLHTKIPNDKWEAHKFADVWFSGQEAIDAGIADGFGEFSPPPGQRLFNVWPPVT